MIAIRIINDEGIKRDIVPESMTVREICERYGLGDYQDMTINEVIEEKISEENLEKSLRELDIMDGVEIFCNNRDRKTAEVFVAGTCAVVKSGVKLDIWKNKIQENQRLGIYDPNGDPMFMVAIEEGPGSLNRHGVIWSSVPTADGYACVTLLLDPAEFNKIGFVEECIGEEMLKLIELERILFEPESKGKDINPKRIIHSI